jgi:hypothetical protein
MVKESVDKVSLASLHSRRRGVLRRYFLGENKNDRREVMGRAPPFWCRRVMGLLAHESTFLGSPDVSG